MQAPFRLMHSFIGLLCTYFNASPLHSNYILYNTSLITVLHTMFDIGYYVLDAWHVVGYRVGKYSGNLGAVRNVARIPKIKNG